MTSVVLPLSSGEARLKQVKVFEETEKMENFLLSAQAVGVAGESYPHECKGPFLK